MTGRLDVGGAGEPGDGGDVKPRVCSCQRAGRTTWFAGPADAEEDEFVNTSTQTAVQDGVRTRVGPNLARNGGVSRLM